MSRPALLRARCSTSLRVRLMFLTAVLAVLFMLALLAAVRGAFLIALEQSVEKRLASEANALISVARLDDGRLSMPEKLPDEKLNTLEAKLLGFIYDREGNLVWQSRSSLDESVEYRPQFNGQGHVFEQGRDDAGNAFFIYDLERTQLQDQEVEFSVVTMQPASDYEAMYTGFIEQLYLWLGVTLLVLLGLLWFGLTLGFRSLRGVSVELDAVEAGTRASLSEHHPRELLRLTGSLNRLLESERQQRERYRHSLDDLAHSLKTPLAVLQSVAEVIATEPHNREQALVLQQQIERMSQQIGYQLQRASLRKSGLVRHSVRLGPLLDTLCAALDKVYRDKQVSVQRDFAAEQHLPMERGALLELLGNLLENSYRLCLGRIRVSVTRQGRVLEIRVEDDGPGVPADQRERILRRGERLDAQHPGQGIGTAVVKDIIESYGGELLLEDSALGGACFRVRLKD